MLRSSGTPETDLERHLSILNHARTLLINACATITYSRNKITKPILEWARKQDIRVSAYLDDWVVLGKTKSEAIKNTETITRCLTSLGWLINWKKSHIQPSQVLEHLGFELNTIQMTARLPGKKLRNFRKFIQQRLKAPLQTPRTIQSMIMRIQAATFAIFPARLFTQHLLHMKNNLMKDHPDWDRPHHMTEDSRQELQWWLHNLKHWNGQSILPSTPTHTLYVDASNTGWGCAYKSQRAHGYWTEEETNMSINWRKLKAAFLALQTFPQLKNTTVLLRTDNTTSLSYINKQGEARSHSLMILATTLWKWCLQQGLMLIASHVSGTDNIVADYESRRSFTKNQ
jgi:hypothetical protein